ncbi:hypothetical protein LUZ60_008015 [Juncus effusus]|nr:hypothetical protein LUZ60_008015 [Juncus effusus]
MAEEVQNGSSAAVAVASLTVQVSVPASKAEEALTFYKAAFGAEEVRRACCPKRKADQEHPSVLCAELKLGSASLLICGQLDDSSVEKVSSSGAIMLRVQVDDVEAAVAKAGKAGAQLQGEITEDESACGGGTFAKLVDPFGVSWAVTCAAAAPKKADELEAQVDA